MLEWVILTDFPGNSEFWRRDEAEFILLFLCLVMLANGKVTVICYGEHILCIGAYPVTVLSEFGHTTDLLGSSRRRNFKVSDKCKQLLIINEFRKQIHDLIP